MKITNTDGTIVETNSLSDETSILLEKLAELKTLCVLYKVPLFAALSTRASGELRPSTCFSVHHPSEDAKTVSQHLLGTIIRWWNSVLPRQELVLQVREDVA